MPPSGKSKAKKKQQSFWSRHSLGVAVAAIALGIMLVGTALFCLSSHSGEDKWVYIPESSTTGAVKDSLKSVLGAAEGNRIYFLWKLQGGDAEKAHGAYRVADGQTAIATSRRLATGRQTPVRLTFSNVRTLDRLAERLASQVECTSDEILLACSEVLPSHGFKPEGFPAAFLPDSYEFYWTTGAGDLVSRLLEYRNSFWNDERRRKASALGLTPVEVATLASIVEEESNKSDERPVIARLYLNRLDKGMRLQADPTVKFATGNFSLRRILGSHLATPSAYNTYLNAGLPPGPIRVASKSAIDNVLDAPRHGYLYMCAREDFSGYHNFAGDFATHRENARRYRAALDRRNIK